MTKLFCFVMENDMQIHNTRNVFLFPGQGAQYRGMGADFRETPAGAELFQIASDITGRDMTALLQDADDETLKRTDVSQPAITLVNLAAARYLAEQGIQPAGCAGFSLGEYAALTVAGVISPEECFKLVKKRGEAMQIASDRLGTGKNAPGMAAILGLAPDQVEALIAEWRIPGLYPANFNSPRQVAVSGTAEALASAEPRFKQAGAKRFIRLGVAGPFHSPLISDAAEQFRPALEALHFRDPVIPFYSNVSGSQVLTGEEAKRLSLRQITEPVRWIAEEQAIDKDGPEAVLETGPGKVLTGLWKDSDTSIPCFGAGTVEAIHRFISEKTK
ncbi:MAG: ACP S-malonyltransferase [Spirochaetaceae bacterium]|jgi:[acyl-carrier-protein] S-malonyltransferase|nr:ACP S-malonyltransferase [Spirochaetaceae bacterium]